MCVRFIGGILEKLERHPKRIVFPEGNEPRVLQAARQFYSLRLGAPILLGDRTRIKEMAANLNLSLKAGETVALVGPSGAGKSTLAGLLPRFHDPSEGKVLLDGVDLREFSLKNLRDSVALVPQRPFLFDATVRENVFLGQTEHTDLEVEKVCELAYADEFVKEFRHGYEERLGEDGSRLSGGQLQRIALARAFLKNAPILVLDEATSALDAENEDKIRDAMAKLIEGKTTLLIAHRFSSLKLAQRILVMDEGRIIADGSHEELHRECDLYRKLYDSQFGNDPEDEG